MTKNMVFISKLGLLFFSFFFFHSMDDLVLDDVALPLGANMDVGVSNEMRGCWETVNFDT
jgi:hypothetical protein